MTAVLRSTNFLSHKIPDEEKLMNILKRDLYNICDTFEGVIVRKSCEKFYTEFYQWNIDLQIAERRRLLESTIFSEQKFTEFLEASSKKRIGEEKRVRHNEYNVDFVPELFDLPNNQEEGVEYDDEVKNLLDESEIHLQELCTILTDFRTYQREVKNILSENGIIDLSPSSEFVLLHLEETNFDSYKLMSDNPLKNKEITEEDNNVFDFHHTLVEAARLSKPPHIEKV
ncbi:1421_t:CDS:2 [Diversispora eburnea]|uniref:1421_t:CDS:1 n=1 Tax=Diversispora eburnea TaxID=1213867 RepID=A0A9N9GRW3_9GLOM|nr:1421_t:CDS:2 [Diversispora eburnea]